MNELEIRGSKRLFGVEVPNIFGGFKEEEKCMLVKTISMIHSREPKAVNQLINTNRNRFIDGTHILDLKGIKNLEVILVDHGIMSQQAINRSDNLYLLSQRGYTRLLKIMDDDKAWEQWDVIENEYFDLKEQKQDLSLLSPELQVLINLELKSKEQEKQIHELRLISKETKKEIRGIREVISLNVKNWIINARGILNSIARKIGEKEDFKENIRNIYSESYDLLDKRLGINLKRRLTELKKRASLKGMTKSKLEDLCYLDVIEADKKLIEGYLAIVKELAIKYGVEVSEEGAAI